MQDVKTECAYFVLDDVKNKKQKLKAAEKLKRRKNIKLKTVSQLITYKVVLAQGIFLKKDIAKKIKLISMKELIRQHLSTEMYHELVYFSMQNLITNKLEIVFTSKHFSVFENTILPFINANINTTAVYMKGVLTQRTFYNNVKNTCVSLSNNSIMCSFKSIFNFIAKKMESCSYFHMIAKKDRYVPIVSDKDITLSNAHLFLKSKDTFFFKENNTKHNKHALRKLNQSYSTVKHIQKNLEERKHFLEKLRLESIENEEKLRILKNNF